MRLLVVTLVIVLVPTFAPAQEPKPPVTPPAFPTATPSATPTGTKPATEEKPAPEEKPEVKAFNELKTQWAEHREKMFAMQVDYKNAQTNARAPIAENYEKLRAEGEQLQTKLIDAAKKANAADPKHKAVGDFLASFAAALYGADRYAEALALAETLIKNEYGNKRIYNLAGKAAYGHGDFDLAEKYLKTAQDATAIDIQADHFLGHIPAYKTLWKKEQEIREAEKKADNLPRVELKTTEGTIVLELFENEAPNTVANFISLVEKKFYDGTAFHRVVQAGMAQGGDPNGDGSGGPGYNIPCECYEPNKRNHFRGSLSMAHKSRRDSGGSQFFITFLPAPNLDGKSVDPKNTGACHTVFGRVLSGEDVLAKLERRDPPTGHSTRTDLLPPADKIVEAKVLRKRDHAYEPKKVSDKPLEAAPPAPAEKPAEDKKPDAEKKPAEKPADK